MFTCPDATLKESVEESRLDQNDEVLNTYNSTHAILCVGDFNASMKERPGNLQDRQFIDFVHRNSGSPSVQIRQTVRRLTMCYSMNVVDNLWIQYA